ncbi:DUF4865 family protein [Clostridium estertheticum]|uniref:DUF4865 family protein n=1 Tax=Clostridium estertheticum TaxID=238834 RepID=A0A7Y3SZ68_9CLOT|nr:DUF4865 family protein [Clostridium estertheticum]NNU78081.1 DUF4865 family protein [Clostridium estertheticum]WBL49514.1 DUF4865 family protein [Clostridium estertheticum]
MIGMQYKVTLPSDYDMNIIRKRVSDNGFKTDGFLDLQFKAYLITEKDKNKNLYNSYSPLYIWNNNVGMNKFLFDGYYDSILNSFGWQQINIGIPFYTKMEPNFSDSTHALEITGTIPESVSLTTFKKQQVNLETNYEILGQTCIYNPDKWGFSKIYFFKETPDQLHDLGKIYEILHLSLGNK